MSYKVKNYYELLPKDLKRETKLDKNVDIYDKVKNCIITFLKI